jgi:nitroreductase
LDGSVLSAGSRWLGSPMDAMSDLESATETALAALLAHRSVSPRRLAPPGPGDDDIERMLQVAMRGPDHGGLWPWRVIEVAQGERAALAQLFEEEKLRREPAATSLDRARAREHATNPPVLLVFVVSPKATSSARLSEQWLEAGAALGNLLNAAHLLGYGACILSGERCADEALQRALGLQPLESLAGFVSVGHMGEAPPPAKNVSPSDVWKRWSVARAMVQT